jgi:hypothetical protein
MQYRFLVPIVAAIVLAAFSGCDQGAPGEETREAVLMTNHVIGASIQASLREGFDLEKTEYDSDAGVVTFTETPLEQYGLDLGYTSVDGEARVRGGNLQEADLRLSGGPITELSYEFQEADPLADEWTVTGAADGSRFDFELSTEEVQAFSREIRSQ